MSLSSVERIVTSVLYEGYILYPYRASAVKNRQRFTFGTLYPSAFCNPATGTDRCLMRTECLVNGSDPVVDVRVRFLQPQAREIRRVSSADFASAGNSSAAPGELVETLEVEGRTYQTWQEAVEREIPVCGVVLSDATTHVRHTFAFPAHQDDDWIRTSDGAVAGHLSRRQLAVEGGVTIDTVSLSDTCWKLGVSVSNDTPLAGLGTRDEVLLQSLASTHTILQAVHGEFVSLFDPPEALREAAAACENSGTWPVLVGEQPARDVMLSSPIILYDYPQVAPESAGDFFDLTEVDEMLSLRVMTLTDDEKQLMRSIDDRARRILQRTEALDDEHWLALHGAARDSRGKPQEDAP